MSDTEEDIKRMRWEAKHENDDWAVCPECGSAVRTVEIPARWDEPPRTAGRCSCGWELGS